MSLVTYLHIGILSFLLGAQLYKRSFLESHARRIFIYTLWLTAIVLAYTSHVQFMLWADAPPPAQYLVPPYQGIGYFLFYITARFWGPYTIAALIGAIILYAGRYGNKKWQGKFFYAEEPYLIATAITTVSHPIWIGYLLLTLIAYCLYLVLHRLWTKRNDRLTFYYFWLPTALAVLLATPLIARWEAYLLLKL